MTRTAALTTRTGRLLEGERAMAGAMFVPAIGAIVLFWCSVVHRDAIFPLEHIAMLPAMVAVMLFHRSEYSRPVHSHAANVDG